MGFLEKQHFGRDWYTFTSKNSFSASKVETDEVPTELSCNSTCLVLQVPCKTGPNVKDGEPIMKKWLLDFFHSEN